MLKSAIRAMPLASFNIRPLTLWVNRPQKNWDDVQKKYRSQFSGEELEKALQDVRVGHEKEINGQPTNVGELIRTYRYRFPLSKYMDRYYCIGLGKEPINKLKKKLVELGLTPDDWPALVPHDDLLEHLSKSMIITLPVREIFPAGRRCDYLHYYLGCTQEEVEKKTVWDLIQVNPLDLQKTSGGDHLSSAVSFFRDHKRQFVAIRQQLAKKGFLKDGPFFKWNPVAPAFKKAQNILRSYDLTPPEIRKFAKIVVAERWVV